MGTLLGVLFIATAAAAGVLVGMRPTVMDGRWMASKLSEMAGDEGAIWCDREIRLGVAGAEFSCTHSHDGGRRQVWYRLTRTGALESLRSGPLERGPGEGGPGDSGDSGDSEAAGAPGVGDEAEAAEPAGAGDAGDEAEAASEEAPPARKRPRGRKDRGREPSAE